MKMIQRIKPENIYYTLVLIGGFAAGVTMINQVLHDVDTVSKQVESNMSEIKALSSVNSSLMQMEKRIDQNAALLAIGNRYTKEDHNAYSLRVDKRFAEIEDRAEKQLTTIRTDINALREENREMLRLIYSEVKKTNGNH